MPRLSRTFWRPCQSLLRNKGTPSVSKSSGNEDEFKVVTARALRGVLPVALPLATLPAPQESTVRSLMCLYGTQNTGAPLHLLSAGVGRECQSHLVRWVDRKRQDFGLFSCHPTVFALHYVSPFGSHNGQWHLPYLVTSFEIGNTSIFIQILTWKFVSNADRKIRRAIHSHYIHYFRVLCVCATGQCPSVLWMDYDSPWQVRLTFLRATRNIVFNSV